MVLAVDFKYVIVCFAEDNHEPLNDDSLLSQSLSVLGLLVVCTAVEI